MKGKPCGSDSASGCGSGRQASGSESPRRLADPGQLRVRFSEAPFCGCGNGTVANPACRGIPRGGTTVVMAAAQSALLGLLASLAGAARPAQNTRWHHFLRRRLGTLSDGFHPHPMTAVAPSDTGLPLAFSGLAVDRPGTLSLYHSRIDCGDRHVVLGVVIYILWRVRRRRPLAATNLLRVRCPRPSRRALTRAAA